MAERQMPEKRPVVLVVDDEPTTRLLMRQALQLGGFTVLEAADGPTALSLVDQEAPNVVILDARLPGMDGFATCKAMRATAGGPGMSILMVTGMDAVSLRSWALEVGADDILSKPVNLWALGDRVKALAGC